jgi:hypothetical protein
LPHVEQRHFEEDEPKADSGVLEVKGGVLQPRDDALSVIAAELLLPEMVAGADANDVIELRKQNALCCTDV